MISLNQPPEITNSFPETATVGEPYLHTVTAVDPDGDALSYSLLYGPDGMEIDPDTGLVSWDVPETYVQGQTAADPYCAEPREELIGPRATADIIAIVDESGSMAQEQAWITDLIPRLEESLVQSGIGALEPNQYGLIGFLEDAREIPVDGELMGSAQGFVEAAGGLRVSGEFEDGWRALQHALDQYPHRPGAARNIILVTDEGRDIVDDTITYEGLVSSLKAGNHILNVVVSAMFRCTNGRYAIGMDYQGRGYIQDGLGGFTTCPACRVEMQWELNSVEAYVNPALETGGAAWNIIYLASGGHSAESMAKAMLSIKHREIVNNLPPAPLADITLTDLTLAPDADGFQLGATALNRGIEHASYPLIVRFYAGTSGDPADLLGELELTDGLSAGSQQAVTLHLDRAPDDVSSIMATIESAEPLSECHTDNNRITGAVVGLSAEDPYGADDQQHFAVNVMGVNHSPVITSTPVTTGYSNLDYETRVEAEDPDVGDSFEFSLESAPAGMTINPLSGTVRWSADESQPGTFTITVKATDIGGLDDFQTFDLVMAEPANPPYFTSEPVTTAQALEPYAYQATAESDRGLALHFDLPACPQGMTIDPTTGAVTWEPTEIQEGIHRISIQVTDTDGLSGFQIFDLETLGRIPPVSVSLSVDPQVIQQGRTTTVTVTAQGGRPPVTLELEVDGFPTPLDASGQAVVTGGAPGAYTLTATAWDADGSDTAFGYFSVQDPTDTDPPVVGDPDPPSDTEITAPTPIVGTVDDENLAQYRLLAVSRGGDPFSDRAVDMGGGADPVIAGELGVFDPTLLLNGIYDLYVTAWDVNGALSYSMVTYQVTGNMKIGHFSFTVEDLSVPVAGIPISVQRSYDTRCRSEELDFGRGWSVDYQNVRIHENRILGAQWRQVNLGGTIPTYCLEPIGAHFVTVTLPDGQVLEFDMGVSPDCQPAYPPDYVDPVFTARAGTNGTLVSAGTGAPLAYHNGILMDPNTAGPYDPSRYVLTTGQGVVYELDQEFGITRITEPNGNSLTYSDQGVLHSSGVGVTFHRDDRGRITRVTDPKGGMIDYQYDDVGDLVAVTDRTAETTRYEYDERSNLLTTTDPMGAVVTRTYNEQNLITRLTDSLGQATEFAYDAFRNPTLITNALGHTQTFEYAAGNLTALTDELGHTTTYAYDASGFSIRETDALGNETRYTRDANGNELTATRTRTTSTGPVTVVTRREYDEAGRVIAEIDAMGGRTTTEYNAIGKEAAVTDPLGNRTEYEYDNRGHQVVIRYADGTEEQFEYDAEGNKISQTDRGGRVTSFEYDALNRLVRTIHPDNAAEETVYDAAGRLIREIDGAGHATEYEYDALGNLTRVTDAAGFETRYTYDELGNKLTRTDALGRVTSRTYDNAGRVLSSRQPGGQTDSFSYDAGGNLLTHLQYGNSMTWYTYDVMGRLVFKKYQDQSLESYQYTDTGELLEVRDSRGLTRYAYNDRDRPVQVDHPDGSRIEYSYNARGDRTSVTTAAGTVTYTYDVLNRLATVTDPDSGVTEYSYDAVGNRDTVTLPNGTVTSYTYDSLNRLVDVPHRTFVGELLSSYSYTLGPAGNRLSVLEHTGRAVDYSYDDVYRLTGEDVTDPVLGNSSTSYTYDAVGNRLAKTSDGNTVSYSYDASDRLLSEGPIIQYFYDHPGNLIQKYDPYNASIKYEYDCANRLTKVNHASGPLAGSITTYTYDHDGIRMSATTDGHTVNYLVDKNRPFAQVLEERDAAGNLLVSYVYGDDLISRHESGASYYHYDGQISTRQLTDETEAVTHSYTYDAFGSLTFQDGATANRYLYTGEQYDPNAGFYYLRARYYDPQTGRFTSMDPWEGAPADPMTLHKYLYANANPVMYADPSGLFSINEMMTTIRVMLSNIHLATPIIANRSYSMKPIAQRVSNICTRFARYARTIRVKVGNPRSFDEGLFEIERILGNGDQKKLFQIFYKTWDRHYSPDWPTYKIFYIRYVAKIEIHALRRYGHNWKWYPHFQVNPGGETSTPRIIGKIFFTKKKLLENIHFAIVEPLVITGGLWYLLSELWFDDAEVKPVQ